MSHLQEDLGDLTPKDFDTNKGVNVGSLLLVLLVLVIVCLFSAYILYLVFGTDMLMDHSGDIINGLTCDKSNLIDASTAPCCAGQGNFIVSDIRYLADIDMTVGTNPQDYGTVCRGYCSSFTGSGCVNSDEDVNYQKCISNLKPVNCNGLAMPVAQIGAQRYYGQSAGYQADAICSTKCVCGLSTCQVVAL
jgi:hypothetical protein